MDYFVGSFLKTDFRKWDENENKKQDLKTISNTSLAATTIDGANVSTHTFLLSYDIVFDTYLCFHIYWWFDSRKWDIFRFSNSCFLLFHFYCNMRKKKFMRHTGLQWKSDLGFICLETKPIEECNKPGQHVEKIDTKGLFITCF